MIDLPVLDEVGDNPDDHVDGDGKAEAFGSDIGHGDRRGDADQPGSRIHQSPATRPRGDRGVGLDQAVEELASGHIQRTIQSADDPGGDSGPSFEAQRVADGHGRLSDAQRSGGPDLNSRQVCPIDQ